MKKVLITLTVFISSLASAELNINWEQNIEVHRKNFASIQNVGGQLQQVHCNDILLNGYADIVDESIRYYGSIIGLSDSEREWLIEFQRKKAVSAVTFCIQQVSRMTVNQVIGRTRYRGQVYAMIGDKARDLKGKIRVANDQANAAEAERPDYVGDEYLTGILNNYIRRKSDEIKGLGEDFTIFVSNIQRKLRKRERFSTDLNDY